MPRSRMVCPRWSVEVLNQETVPSKALTEAWTIGCWMSSTVTASAFDSAAWTTANKVLAPVPERPGWV